MLNLQIASKSKNIPSKKQFKKWVEIVLQHEKTQGDITIRVVDRKESQELNKQYRHKNKPTNVLSFSQRNASATKSSVKKRSFESSLLGDLVICAPIVREEAKKQHKNLLDHWAHLSIHGTLHLLGYDHEVKQEASEMENIEIKLLANLNIANPYEAA